MLALYLASPTFDGVAVAAVPEGWDRWDLQRSSIAEDERLLAAL